MKTIPFGKIGELEKLIKTNIKKIKLLCTVTEKKELPEHKLTILKIKDETGTTEARIFGEENERNLIIGRIKEGDTILLIGIIRKIEDETYIIPEGIKKLNQEWSEYYKLRYKRYKTKSIT